MSKNKGVGLPPYHEEIKNAVATFRDSMADVPKKDLEEISNLAGKLLVKMKNLVHIQHLKASGQFNQAHSEQKVAVPKQQPSPKAVVAQSAGAVAVADPPKLVARAKPVENKRPEVVLYTENILSVKKVENTQPQQVTPAPIEKMGPVLVANVADQKLSIKDRLAKFLEPQKVKVISIHEESKHDAILDDVATKLGEDFHVMRKTLSFLRAAYSDDGIGSKLLDTFASDKKSQERVLSFFNYAKRYLLIEYGIVGKRRFLSFKIDVENALFRKFLTGNWFERFIYITVLRKCSFLSKNSIIARNVELEFPSGDKAEIDMVIIHRNQLYLLEMKTRDYKEAVMKYKNRAPLLGIPLENIFFVMMERQGDDHKHMEAFHRMRFLIADELVSELNKQFAPNPQLAQG